jgi:ferredoxin
MSPPAAARAFEPEPEPEAAADQVTVSFDPGHAPVRLPRHTPLAEALDVTNSPLLFGCRTGACGTCMIEVEPAGALPPPSDDERELLEIFAPGDPKARLACQLDLACDLRCRPHPEAP